MIKYVLRLTMIFSLLSPFACVAADNTQPVSGIGFVAYNLLQPVGLFSELVQGACFIVGASFLFASIIKYIEHRRSPLMVPISTVIFLLIAGVLLILLPFLSLLVDTGIPISLV